MAEFKDKIIEDLISICSIPDISETILHECLRLVFSWALTARDDNGNSAKYFGCPYWSQNALDHYNKHGNVKGLRHEHIIPRAIFNKSIEEYRKKCILKEDFNYKACFDYLKKHISEKLIACVITEGEDKSFSDHKISRCMPKSSPTNFFDITNPWARYKEAGITDICKVEWTKPDKKSSPWEYKITETLNLK